MKKARKAAAVKYEHSYDAPMVTARGMGDIADKILEKAKESDVPIVYNKELADLLNNVDVGEFIPSELYEAIAEIIAYITDIDALLGER
ncbi:EscU/YscU/HrcU family type III secretion system export apparatus switch protein [Clostridium algidicarnis]|uniref:EscU/YscU/HrcU family type III secretion system export apparatus switch protein n=1 Tax=Clostridium algidicarnis TaxID=37659 RepID=UPI001C0AC9AB|nr:EscU/YscU/HrcU family type III secretion system export apparatus switch protein [Clostridium algidicarnis]MBU3196429.1 EscU/YscU/HrcU family type III secretion system export apparatus switch protein [Clostridium algidicarnis]MBU3209579.1 EscU/YscU/HrcU family type III secretion system export apparatus switch protein [Clostridium algidicarnis]MBU3227167.1 EscU/YscU/HrcU family type III secretion system export apparatus switch protein [Clostridium algidicarnis]MBU3250692.1 EscU/YscU/HrcU famil